MSSTSSFDFYRRGLAHILRLNAAGIRLREDYTTILLQKIFSSLSASYVDLQSPAGIGIAGIVYNYDGAVYASDEGRMLAEMGDETFRLGHVSTSGYEELVTSDALLTPLGDTILECVPRCNDCAFLPYAARTRYSTARRRATLSATKRSARSAPSRWACSVT